MIIQILCNETDKLFYNHPNPILDWIVEDLNAWKLAIPVSVRNQVTWGHHNWTQADHMGIDNTYVRIATEYYCSGTIWDLIREKMPGSPKRKKRRIGSFRINGSPNSRRAVHCSGCWHHTLLSASSFRLRVYLGYAKSFNQMVRILPTTTRSGPENLRRLQRTHPYALARDYNIYHTTTPPIHSQSNPAERVNRVLETMVFIFIEHDHRIWSKFFQISDLLLVPLSTPLLRLLSLF